MIGRPFQRLIAFAHELELGKAIGRVLLGGTPSGPEAMPQAPDIVAKFAKLWGMLAVWLLAWADRHFGWNLSETIGGEFGDICWFLISGYLGWRVPQRTSG